MKKNRLYFLVQEILIELKESGVSIETLKKVTIIQAWVCVLITIIINVDYFIGLLFDVDKSALKLFVLNCVMALYWCFIELQYKIIKRL